MDLFHGLIMLGGLSLFLFGMSLMGQPLERRAGCVNDMRLGNLNLHESLRAVKVANSEYARQFTLFEQKYALK